MTHGKKCLLPADANMTEEQREAFRKLYDVMSETVDMSRDTAQALGMCSDCWQGMMQTILFESASQPNGVNPATFLEITMNAMRGAIQSPNTIVKRGDADEDAMHSTHGSDQSKPI